jgi:hypothetical protein
MSVTELAASRVASDLSKATEDGDLIILSRLVDFISTLKGENPRALAVEFDNAPALLAAMGPKITDLMGKAEALLKKWRSSVKQGDAVDMYSAVDGKWFPSQIVQVAVGEDNQVQVLVHYLQWERKWDTWVNIHDQEHGMSPKESKVKHTQIKTPHESWLPNSMREHVAEEERRAEEKEKKAEAKRQAAEAARQEEREKQREINAADTEYDEHGNPIKKRKRELTVKEKAALAAAERAENGEEEDDNDWVCGECGMLEHPTGNAMLLCDGACMRSFHLPCLGMKAPPSGDWFCIDCTERRHECFICKEKGTDYAEVAKCMSAKCGKYYHRTCLTDPASTLFKVDVRDYVEKVPPTGPVRAAAPPSSSSAAAASTTEGESSSSSSSSKSNLVPVNSFRFKCPQHHCDTCDSFFARTKMDKSKSKNTELFECIECPRAYHINCIPPGARFNSCCLMCDGHPNRVLPSREPITRAYRGVASVLEQLGIPEDPPLVSDVMDHHFKLPLQLREEVSQEAEPAPFHKVVSLQYDSLTGGVDAVPPHHPDGVCQCVDQCDEFCWNRLLKIECFGKADDKVSHKEGGRLKSNCKIGAGCGNRLFSTRGYGKMKRFREHAMGMGMKADEDVIEGTLMCEYVGEVIDETEMVRRMENQAKFTPNDHEFYIMELDTGIYVDGKHKGSESRHINHSCDPNLELERWVVNGKMRIGIFAIKNIAKGEPLNYDYQFDTRESASFKCFCGTEKCRGTMAPKAKGEERPLSARERKSLIKQGQLRESGGDNKAARVQAELSRCHTSRYLPGDITNEIRNGPHKYTFISARRTKVFLTENVMQAARVGWGKRRALMWCNAEDEQLRWMQGKERFEAWAKAERKAGKKVGR